MSGSETIYNNYFKAKDRFSSFCYKSGYEPDIISDYVNFGMQISSLHKQGAKEENLLLCEYFLRQVYLNVLEAISDPRHTATFRKICLDSIYTPLFGLRRYYNRFEHGDVNYLRLKQKLQHVQPPLD